MKPAKFRLLLFVAAIVVACVDQFAMHGTSFEWTLPAHSTWMDGCAAGLLFAALATNLLRRAEG